MDRSFLSRSDVIEASRRFVCARLATYESEQEAGLLRTVFVGRSGELENTVFCILAPDGKTKLVRSGRSPLFAFAGPEDIAAQAMVAAMNRIAASYPGNGAPGQTPVPALATARLALNVAACENQPLVLTVAPDAVSRASLEERLAPVAWQDEFAGRFQYASASDPRELASISGVRTGRGMLVVQPDRFGTSGRVIVELDSGTGPARLAEGLRAALRLHRTHPKETFEHRTAGERQGAHWETAIPVTDPHALAQQERGPGRPRQRPRR